MTDALVEVAKTVAFILGGCMIALIVHVMTDDDTTRGRQRYVGT